MPRYTAKLSPGSFRELAEKVRKYRLSLPEKCEEFARRLSEIGLQKANMILSEHVETGQTIGSLRIENNSDGKISRMTVVVSSNAILFLEFGAGVKYSKTENPKADELGYGPGTYPTGKLKKHGKIMVLDLIQQKIKQTILQRQLRIYRIILSALMN